MSLNEDNLKLYLVIGVYIFLYLHFIYSTTRIYFLNKRIDKLNNILKYQVTVIKNTNDLLKNESYEIKSKLITEEI